MFAKFFKWLMSHLEKGANFIAYSGALLFIVGIALYAITQRFGTEARITLFAGLILLLIFVLLRPESVQAALTGRTARYGSNTLVMSLAFLGILILVNFMSNRYHRRFDLTASQKYSLSPQTIQILQNLKEPVQVKAFFSPIDPYLLESQEKLEELLREYAYHSPQISYEFIDPDQKPGIAQQYEITNYGTVVFERGDKRQKTLSTDEQGLTSALLKVTQAQVKVIYFTTGHKEHNPTGYDKEGYSQIKDLLGKENYEVKTINLATITDTLPSELSVLVIAGPKIPFADEERAILAKYLEGGGKALIMADPDPDVESPLDDVLSKWGVRFNNDVVVDRIGALLGDPLTPLVAQYRYSTITKDLGGLSTIFPRARSIKELEEKPEKVRVNILFQTSEDSWGETDFNALAKGEVRYNEDKDTKGPLTLAVSVISDETKTRLVLLGDSDFVANGLFGSVRGFGNGDLFLNTINWLAEEEELISIRPKTEDTRPIILTPVQMRIISYTSYILLPLTVLIVGAVVWWQRR